MELRRIIKLALISRINTSIKKSVAIKQNSILSLFFRYFCSHHRWRIFVLRKLTIIDTSLTTIVFIISSLPRTALVRGMLLNLSSYLTTFERSASPYVDVVD